MTFEDVLKKWNFEPVRYKVITYPATDILRVEGYKNKELQISLDFYGRPDKIYPVGRFDTNTTVARDCKGWENALDTWLFNFYKILKTAQKEEITCESVLKKYDYIYNAVYPKTWTKEGEKLVEDIQTHNVRLFSNGVARLYSIVPGATPPRSATMYYETGIIKLTPSELDTLIRVLVIN